MKARNLSLLGVGSLHPKATFFDGGVLKKQSINDLIIIINLSTATNICLFIRNILIKLLFPHIIYISLLER